MVTEALPAGCTSCFEDESLSTRRPSTSSRSLNPADGLAGITRAASRTNSISSERENGTRLSFQNQTPLSQASSSAIETPPESPRVSALQSAQFGSLGRRDSSFRKTYDENDKKRAIPCENCALTLPPKNTTKEESSPTHNDINGPILRTRRIYERVSVTVEHPSPPKSECSSSSESEHAISSKPTHRRTRSRTLIRVSTSSSNCSFKSTDSHEHYVDYTSTHEPLHPTSFSILRQSCLRTLSCETLPPSTLQPNSSPTSPFLNSSFSNSSVSIPSGGPIFFGDPLAGYTTAFVFRIPDPNARGRRRVYALISLSTHRERAVMQTFSLLSTAFRELAAWIQGLAEAEFERTESMNSPRLGGSEERSSGGGSSHNTPTSSFLSGRNRGLDGMPRMVTKARGLAEIVGLPDFFIELHARFVRLLVQLGLQLGV
ncbi:hypothetical protein EG329_007144 [Mollisiaceae sp. DMI_Dod_QoI]|nr:hypothetical protein EG329_007144 [Helotiales sp. DMI_Dod_QoI]